MSKFITLPKSGTVSLQASVNVENITFIEPVGQINRIHFVGGECLDTPMAIFNITNP